MTNYSDITRLYKPSKSMSAGKRRGINSVETGIRILEVIMGLGGPSSLKSISDAVGMDSSQVYRYVASLINTGVLVQDPSTSHYDLGPMALKVGLSAIARLDELAVIEHRMREFARNEGATCMLSVWGSNGPVVIRWFQGTPPVFTTLAVGSAIPVTHSATGHIFLGLMSPGILEPQLRSEGRSATLGKNKDLLEIRAKVRKQLVASVDSKFIPGLRAHAAPIVGVQNTLVGVFSVISNNTISKRDFSALKKKLLVCCQTLSADIGGEWDTLDADKV